mmetsp:Transcript_6117/g.5473  ORF Transcript_6117/g.5473 Transcript_6117/m.5473 type:complete len:81 (+) Transcript_6117:786-1028(+)
MICKKIIKEHGLTDVEEGSPIFDALLNRIRLSINFESLATRVNIAQLVQTALGLLVAMRKNANVFKKYESLIYQEENLKP